MITYVFIRDDSICENFSLFKSGRIIGIFIVLILNKYGLSYVLFRLRFEYVKRVY